MNEPLATVKMDDNGLVWFDCRGQQPLPLRPKRPDVLRKGQEMAEEALREAKDTVGGLGTSVDRGREALRILHKAGVDLVHLLAGKDHERAGQLQERFATAWDSWPQPWDLVEEVQVEVSEDAFPFELLPVFDLSELEASFELQTEARRFLGMSTAVRRRVLTEQGPADHQLKVDDDEALPLQFLRHHMQDAPPPQSLWDRLLRRRPDEDESGTDRELRHLRELRITLEGPWPIPPLDQGEVIRRLVDALYDPSLRLDGRHAAPVPVQIHHFACHCDTRANFETKYALRLSTEPGIECLVELGDITRGYQDRRLPGGQGRRERAVVVFNACRSSHVDLMSAGSFPNWFIENGHRAFVGTQVNVPDDIGAEWARLFYTELLGDPPRTLGEAVVRASRGLLEKNCPLGLGYVVYGESALSVAAEPLARTRFSPRSSPLSEAAGPAAG